MIEVTAGMQFEAPKVHLSDEPRHIQRTMDAPHVYNLHLPAVDLHLRLAYSSDGLGIEPLPPCCMVGLTKRSRGVTGFWTCINCDMVYPYESPSFWRGGAREMQFMFHHAPLTTYIESILMQRDLDVFEAALGAIDIEHHIMEFSGGRDCLKGDFVDWWVGFQTMQQMREKVDTYNALCLVGSRHDT